MRRSLFVALSVVLPAAGSCTPWHVVRQSGPPPSLRGVTSMTLAFDWSAPFLGGQTEEAWLAARSDERWEEYAEVKQAIFDAFSEELAARLRPRVSVRFAEGEPEPGEVRLVFRPLDLEMGKFTYVLNFPSSMTARIAWWRDGEVQDEIETTDVVEATLTTPAILQRVRMIARTLAGRAAEYVLRAREG